MDDGQALDEFQDPEVLLQRHLYGELVELLRHTFLNVTGLTRFRRSEKQLGHTPLPKTAFALTGTGQAVPGPA